MNNDVLFYNETLRRRINFDELIVEIVKYIREQPKAEYKITVGTDSDASSCAQFVTAITVLKIGNGGRYF